MELDDCGLDAIEDWQLVGESYYSRRELYSLDWGGGSGAAMDLAFMRCERCSEAGSPSAAAAVLLTLSPRSRDPQPSCT